MSKKKLPKWDSNKILEQISFEDLNLLHQGGDREFVLKEAKVLDNKNICSAKESQKYKEN